ncbi:MAG: ABC transporter permease [bacterium]
MKRIYTISLFTFRELVRTKYLYALVFFALFILGLGITITQATIGSRADIISDIGLGTIEIFSTLLAIFIGITIINRELSEKSLLPVLAHPVSRPAYLLGKFFGMLALILLQMIFMSIIFYILLMFFKAGDRMPTYIPAIYTIFLQTATIVSVSIFCSTLIEPVVAAMITISYYIVGATSYNLIHFFQYKASETTREIVTVLRYLLPDFSYFNIKDNLVYGRGLEDINLYFATIYALCIIILMISAATLFFNSKELT